MGHTLCQRILSCKDLKYIELLAVIDSSFQLISKEAAIDIDNYIEVITILLF